MEPALLWPRHRPAAVAPIQPLAQEPPYAASVAQERKKEKERKKERKKERERERKESLGRDSCFKPELESILMCMMKH